ncbi:MAG: hypothetical protein IPN43_11165 [Chitinophagaceae bacterium]|nr:hypothetical protein [Chitinophagaceae bacterium]
MTAFLNSKLFRFAFREYFPELLGDTRELSKIFFENVRVIKIDDKKNDFFSNLVEQIVTLRTKGEDYSSCQETIENELASLYSLSKEEQDLLSRSL